MSDQNPNDYWLNDVDIKNAEYAPGIEDPTAYGDPSKLQVGSIVPYVQQLHHALRARRHYDVRLGKDKMLSWATKKELPRPGDRPIALFRQPEHDESYSKFQGRIQTGYGAGTVRPVDLGSVMITQASPDKIKFVMAHKRTPEEFTLVRMQAKEGMKPAWLMINSTPTEGPKYQKEHYKLIPAEQIDKLMDPQYTMSAKIDGASAFVKLMKDKVDVLSLRPSVEGGPIVHTHRLGLGGQKLNIPKELQNTLLRGEIYGTRGKTDRAIRPEELGGILNSTVENSVRAQKAKDVKLRVALFGAKEVGGKPWEGRTHEETRKIIQGALKHLPADIFGEPAYAYTPEEKQKLWKEITTGRFPVTREGVVGFPVSGGTPVKVKPVQDYDVHIREIFPQVKGDTNLAGGFRYSHEAGGPIAGEIGSGFSRAERKRMMANPEEYIGRVARVTAQEQYPSGALRAPTYIARHEDPTVKLAADETLRFTTDTDPDFPKGNIRYNLMSGDNNIGHAITLVPHVHPEKATFLREIYVAPDHRGKDHVRRLIEHVKAQNADKPIVLRPLPFEYIPGTTEETTDSKAVGGRTKEDLIAMYKHLGFEHHPTKKDRMILRTLTEKKADLTLISGFIGSGKSTTAKRMAKEEGAKYVPVDVLRTENRDKSLKEFMVMLGEKAKAAAKSKDKIIMEGIHVARLPLDVLAEADKLIKVDTPEAESTVRAIARNIERSKKPESKMYGWPVMKIVRNVVENQVRFRDDVERFGETKDDGKWVAVDLDSCLAEYHGWKGHEHIGKPVPKMLARVKRMLADGETVKIFTARAADGKKAIDPIKAWCRKHLGRELEVTNVKDHNMSRLYDDRAITIGKNTGEIKSAQVVEDRDPDINMEHRRFTLNLDGRQIGRATAMKKARVNKVEVTDLYVDPAYRGRGVAAQLIDRISDEYKLATLCLKPHPFADKLLDRDELIGVYEKLGFELVPGRRNEMVLANYKSAAFKLGLESATPPSFDKLVAEAQPATPVTPAIKPLSAPPAVVAKPAVPVRPVTPDWSAYRQQAAGIKKVYPKFNIDPDVITNAVRNTHERTGKLIPPELIGAQAWLETHGGTKGRNPRVNPFNVGNTDAGAVRRFTNQAQGVQAYTDLMATNYLLGNKTADDFIRKPVNYLGKRYASDPEYSPKLKQIVTRLRNAQTKGVGDEQVNGVYKQ